MLGLAPAAVEEGLRTLEIRAGRASEMAKRASENAKGETKRRAEPGCMAELGSKDESRELSSRLSACLAEGLSSTPVPVYVMSTV